MPHLPAARPRALTAPLVAAVTAALLGGCGWLGGPTQPTTGTSTATTTQAPDRTDEENQTTAAELNDSLTAIPGVDSAEVHYTNDFTTPATVAVDLTVATGSDYEAIFDEVQRQLWLSDLNPMDTMSMSAIDASADPALSQSRRLGYLSDAQRAAFEATYGPRPS